MRRARRIENRMSLTRMSCLHERIYIQVCLDTLFLLCGLFSWDCTLAQVYLRISQNDEFLWPPFKDTDLVSPLSSVNCAPSPSSLIRDAHESPLDVAKSNFEPQPS